MAELRTDRFFLRSPVLEDAARITEIVNDPCVYEMIARVPPRQTTDQTGQWVLNCERGNELGTDHAFAVFENMDLVAMVSAHRPDDSQPFEIGYWVAPEAWGRGIATEVAKELIIWLEERGQADELISGYFIDNLASGRVLSKLGFTRTHVAPVFCAGRERDVEHIFMVRKAETG